MITAQVEALRDVLAEMRPLFPLHYADLSLHAKHGFELDPQYGVYLERERQGMVLCVTLRKDGRIIGYQVGFIAPGLHYQGCLTHSPDIFFIHPEHRGGSAALRLFRAYEKELRRRGVDLWFGGSKNHKSTGQLFESLGFEAVETIYAKWLD